MQDLAATAGTMLTNAYHSGTIIDLILVLVAVEALALHWLDRRLGRGPGLAAVWPTIASGALLLLAVRAALTQAWWGWIGLLLALAGLLHVLDLMRRVRHGR